MSTRKGKSARRGRKPAGARVEAEEIKAASDRDIDIPPKEDLIAGQIRPQTSLGRGPRKEAKKGTPAPGTARWELVGPTNIGGRLTSIVCHPKFPERIWAGAAGGGVWFSPDAGQSWQSQWFSQDVLNVGSLAIDPTNPDVIYCGTGEANLSADSYPGVGLYQTADGGKNWRLLAPKATTRVPSRIGVIAIDPFDPKHLRLGGVSHSLPAFTDPGEKDLGGMFFSADGGISWKRETFVGVNNHWCHSVVFHPTKKGTIFATFTERGTRNGIYKTTDGGKTWRQLTKGLPTPARIGRTTL